ncbi:MAG: amidase [Gammaproteobacteria bacterium]|nr:amidase [Gammaproteobacteria bacterium]
MSDDFEDGIREAGIAQLRSALASGRLSSTALVCRYLNRIARYDRHGIRLNAVPILNPDVFADARTADERRQQGKSLGPLDGIPYLAKASYAVRGLPLTSGSPAFEHLIAREDAFVIAQLRAAGAILIGLTNMPPMAAGGMQRGLFGRAESPYNAAFLTAAFASGSSNGSGSGLAAGFAAFALAEETWSSGRAPATNNGLVAYTPSRGMISMRGNWPLIPTMDVVVPYARSVADLLEVLNVLVTDDPHTRGDFWRAQQAVPMTPASAQRPIDYTALIDSHALRGKRLGVPRMYINKDADSARPIATRPSVIDCWHNAAAALVAAGAEIVEVDFPLVSNYEKDRPGAQTMAERGLAPAEFAHAEGFDAIIFAWDDFLAANDDPQLKRLTDVAPDLIIPRLPGAQRDRYEGIPDFGDYAKAAQAGVTPLNDIPHLADGLRGLEATRELDFEAWLDAQRLDMLVFPAVADIAPADADYNPRSADIAWRNGTWVANGNQAIRHFGIPTVTVPMGTLADIHMPIGLTFAGRAYDDAQLLRAASAFEQNTRQRRAAPRTPPLPDDGALPAARMIATTPLPVLKLDAQLSAVADDGTVSITVSGSVTASAALHDLKLFVNGEAQSVQREGNDFHATVRLPFDTHYALHSRWRGPYGSLVMAQAEDVHGACAASYVVVGGV